MVKCKNTALYFQTALEMIYIIFYLYWKNLVVSFQKESNHDRFGKEVQWRRFEDWIIRCVTSKGEEILLNQIVYEL